MKNRLIELATFILLIATAAAALTTTPELDLLPREWRPYLTWTFLGVLLLKQGAYILLDLLDDGQLNKSYKIPSNLGVALVCCLLVGTLSSCSNGRFLGLTGTEWQAVGAEAGKGALKAGAQTALVEYGARRAAAPVTSAKEPVEVSP